MEVAFLEDDQATPAPAPSAASGEQPRLTVLVVAAEADLRCYVRECLRARGDLRVLEAATTTEALSLAESDRPELLVVDGPESGVLSNLSWLRAIVIVDDVPRGAATPTRVRPLARPFTADRLVQEVDQLLGRP